MARVTTVTELAAVMPLQAATYCPDCEAVFDRRYYRSCPSCANSVTVPVSSLMNKASLLARSYVPMAKAG